MSVEEAERWCDAWELEAAGLGLPKDGNYWQLPQGMEILEEQASPPQ